MPKTKNVINRQKKLQFTQFSGFKLILGVLSIPENFNLIGVTVPDIPPIRARACASLQREKICGIKIFFFNFAFDPKGSPIAWFDYA